ncbi:hypothetical protein E4634_15985 [Mangrovimicrobium sediminis]|uniref:Uncharacterized protein n=1 Tax=Mangrovimicrobium sediminis TaxID=2562682 RepID=A0A4Z0LYB0_9GAMM|nr:hypothetical protein [Haliea sp. SAOS-164]TGD72166.1 hypothetical protein E4634_15985 [Haliea sp. SAOS-164]
MLEPVPYPLLHESIVFHSLNISYDLRMVKRASQYPGSLARAGVILQHAGVLVLGLALAILNTFRELFASVEVRQDEERRLHDSDLSGEYNHRTGRLDAGTDPYGWYDDD